MKNFFISIYLALIVGLLSIAFGVFPITHELLENQSDQFIREISKGTFSLVSERLLGLDDKKQSQELARLQTRFGFPVRVHKIDEFYIDPEDYPAFMQGRIVDDDDQSYIIFQRLGNTETLLAFGNPFPYHGFNHSKQLFLLVLCLLFLSIPALVWSYLLKRDMEKIETSGARLLSGDHGARAMVSKLSSLCQISTFFNAMAEKFQSLLASQKELTNSVSHEIRTPLSRIQFSLEMLSELKEIPLDGKKHIQRITKDVDEIEDLVDEMLTYAKFEGESQNDIQLSKHEIISWLKAIVKEEQNNTTRVKIAFKTKPETMILLARFEPVFLERALRNLIRNGIHYAQSQVVVTLESGQNTRSEKSLNQIQIHVDDDGPGICEEDRDKVFEPFFRVDNSRNRTSGGYGLGLAIVKRIVLWHKGSVVVSNSSLKGARFSICL